MRGVFFVPSRPALVFDRSSKRACAHCFKFVGVADISGAFVWLLFLFSLLFLLSFLSSFLSSFLFFLSFFLSFFFFVLGAGRGNNRSFTTQLLMNIPFQCTYLVTYEVTRRQLNPEGHYKPSAHLIAGGLAGATASAITTPMDVAKTYLNTQELCKGAQVSAELTHTSSRYVMGIVVAWKAIFTELGYSGFFRGITARVVAATPAAAISWSVYEFFKHSLVLVDGF